MTELLAALRALVYMTGFVFVWGWLALQVRSIGWGWALPPGSRALGTVLMIGGGLLVLSCVGWFVVVGRGTPAALRRRFVTAVRRVLGAGEPVGSETTGARSGRGLRTTKLYLSGPRECSTSN